MILQKQGFPEESEIVVCTVTRIQYNSVFVTLNEYNNMSAIIHISEISPGRIRNIRDYVKEGKVVVCMVLRVNKEKGHIDLSLRRVSESQRRNKINEIKQQQKVEKIIEFVAKKNNAELKKLVYDIHNKVEEEFGSIFSFFEEVVAGNADMSYLGLDKKIAKDLDDVVRQRIKPPEVSIGGKFRILSYDLEGVEIIKKSFIDALNRTDEKNNVALSYLGASFYSVNVKASNYKDAEATLKQFNGNLFENMKKDKTAVVEFIRE